MEAVEYACHLPVHHGMEGNRDIIRHNFHPSIIKEISSINFSRLISLDVQKNNIESIETLNSIQAPSLSRINIGTNKIISIRPLRKMSSPRLKLLDFYENMIADASTLA